MAGQYTNTLLLAVMPKLSSYFRLEKVTFGWSSQRPPVLEQISMTIGEAPVVILGPNGAGKTTLLRVMKGDLRHEGKLERPRSIGYSAQTPIALSGFSVADQVSYAAWLAGVPRRAVMTKAKRALLLTSLSGLADRKTTTLSGGERARLGIASAVVAEPEMLLLDEPSASLDPMARRDVHDVLARLAEHGVGIVATSHNASDLRSPFSRVVLLVEGRLQFEGSRQEFLHGEHTDPVVRSFVEALREE